MTAITNSAKLISRARRIKVFTAATIDPLAINLPMKIRAHRVKTVSKKRPRRRYDSARGSGVAAFLLLALCLRRIAGLTYEKDSDAWAHQAGGRDRGDRGS
jgi:hypothetical protein